MVPEGDVFENGFYVPENVYIIGTMNDIDRSVESMDFAFRRRFAFKEIKANENLDMLNDLGEDLSGKSKSRLINLNNKISEIEGLDSSYHIGADYFLHYMLQKVFAINLFDIKHSSNRENIFDFLAYLFPYFLKKALAQGVFKKYQKNEYNDARVRGSIDFQRYIKYNIPFRGNVAYNVKEHSHDNELTQLIRHTIEFIMTKKHLSFILNNDLETKECVAQINMATPSYNMRERNFIINKNLRLLYHPYYSAYTALQKICLQILRHETIKFGKEKDKVYGVLFDGAWLWEEFLFTILKDYDFKHPKNKDVSGGFRMFRDAESDDDIDDNYRRFYPDFYKDDFVIDAKYKHLESGVGREDLYQLVTYMYCKKATNGAYIYPCRDKNIKAFKYQLVGYEGFISVMPFYVPQSANSYEEFVSLIYNVETFQ